MSLSQIRPFFSETLAAAGLTEWDDAFNFENIPSSLVDKAFHQQFVGFQGQTTTAQDIEIMGQVAVRCFFKGFRDPASAVQESVVMSEDVIRACVNPESFAGTQIKGIYFTSLDIQPYDETGNDNIVVAVIVFDVRVFVCIK